MFRVRRLGLSVRAAASVQAAEGLLGLDQLLALADALGLRDALRDALGPPELETTDEATQCLLLLDDQLPEPEPEPEPELEPQPQHARRRHRDWLHVPKGTTLLPVHATRRLIARICPGPPRGGGRAPFAFPGVNQFFTAVFDGRAAA